MVAMKVAYADPPYPGQVAKHYPGGTEVNHRVLIGTLNHTFDAWALSTSSPSLANVLALCPDDVRVGAWVKPFASFKKGVHPAYAWEPVIFRGARNRFGEIDTVRDWHSSNITLQRTVHGAKPEAFSFWVFHLLGAVPTDAFEDVFPGSGAVSTAWDKWCRMQPLPATFVRQSGARLFDE